jgi:hypothetical protein
MQHLPFAVFTAICDLLDAAYNTDQESDKRNDCPNQVDHGESLHLNLLRCAT